MVAAPLAVTRRVCRRRGIERQAAAPDVPAVVTHDSDELPRLPRWRHGLADLEQGQMHLTTGGCSRRMLAAFVVAGQGVVVEEVEVIASQGSPRAMQPRRRRFAPLSVAILRICYTCICRYNPVTWAYTGRSPW